MHLIMTLVVSYSLTLETICLVKTIEVVYIVDIIKQYSHQMVLL